MRRRELLATLTGLTSAALIGLPNAARGDTAPDIAALESLLSSPRSSDAVPVTVAELHRSLAIARAAFEQAHYRHLTDLLPALTASAAASRDASAGRDREQHATVLAHSYALVSELAVKLGEDAMAWVAADRAHTAAAESGDPGVITAASCQVAIAMRHHGHHDGAVSLLTRTALDLGADTGDPGPLVLASYGSLLCTAAYSSAQHGKRAAAIDLITEAEHAAARLPGPAGAATVAGVGFSGTSAAVYRIGIHTALGDSGTALAYARGVNQRLLPNPERGARYAIDTARAWHAHGRVDRAYEALCAAEHYAPEELRRPSVRTLVSSLLHSPGTTPDGLHQLAVRTEVR